MNNTPFVICGSSKSGTTWLQKMLNLHPRIRCHFQTHIFPFNDTERKDLLHSKKIVFNDHKSPFGGLFSSDEEEQEYLDKRRFLLELEVIQSSFIQDESNNKVLEKLKNRIVRAIVTQILDDDSGASELYGTKAYTNIENYLKIFPTGKVVCILRDARDVVVSRRYHVLRMGGYFNGDERNVLLRVVNSNYLVCKIMRKMGLLNSESFKQIDDGHKKNVITPQVLDAYGNDWRVINEYFLEKFEKYPSSILFTKFEDLKKDKAGELTRIFAFLGAEVSGEELTMIDEKSTLDVKKTSKDSFVRKGLSGDWKNYFDVADREYSKRIFSETLVKLGYEKDDNW